MWYVNFETERDALAAFDYLREEVKTFKVNNEIGSKIFYDFYPNKSLFSPRKSLLWPVSKHGP